MGACLGRCFPSVTDPFTFRYSRHTGIGQSPEEEPAESEQYANGQTTTGASKKSKTILSFLTLKRFKKKNRIPVSLELVEDTHWARRSNKYSRLNSAIDLSTSSGLNTPLQPLDVRTLLKHPGCVSSTPASSLDLEWEHEVPPVEVLVDLDIPRTSPSNSSSCGSKPSSLTASPWSRVSTPNSLEWDSVEAETEAAVDAETEQLLGEIERLKNKTLKETGDWTGAAAAR